MEWRQVGIAVGVVRQTAWRRWVAALQTIANHLNRNEKSARRRKSAKKAPDEAAVKPDDGGSETLL